MLATPLTSYELVKATGGGGAQKFADQFKEKLDVGLDDKFDGQSHATAFP